MPNLKTSIAPDTTSPPVTMLDKLHAAVAAKVAYWDAMGSLERALAHGHTLTDNASQTVNDAVSGMALGLDTPNAAYDWIVQEHLDQLVANVKVA